MSGGAPDLSGRVALVTGAARRLGRHLALALGRAGADVVVHYRTSAEEADQVVREIEALGRRSWALAADFLVEGAASRLVHDVGDVAGRLDVLVNNVGNYLVKPLEETTEHEWRDLLDANLVAPFSLMKEAIPLFPEEGGVVINVGYAGVEHLEPNVEATAYQVSKTGLYLLTKAFAARLAGRRIRVNMISPGHLENSVDLPEHPAEAIPLGRPGRLEEVAGALFFLLRADYVTGVNLDVAGGFRM